jgi:hypothetical protein
MRAHSSPSWKLLSSSMGLIQLNCDRHQAALPGPFDAIDTLLLKKLRAHSVPSRHPLSRSAGPIQYNRHHVSQKTMGLFNTIGIPLFNESSAFAFSTQSTSRCSETHRPIQTTLRLPLSSFARPIQFHRYLVVAVGNILGKTLLGPFANIDAGFACSGGPIQSRGNILRRSLLGQFMIIDAGIAWFSGPIESSQKQFLLGPLVNIDARIGWSGKPIQSSREYSRDKTTGPIREHRCWLCPLQRAHLK